MKVEHHVTIHSGLNIHAPVFAESMEEAERLGREWALALLTKTPPADAFFEPPDRMLELTDLQFLHLFGPQVFCTMRDGKLASVPKELEDFLVEQLEMAAMRADC